MVIFCSNYDDIEENLLNNEENAPKLVVSTQEYLILLNLHKF